MDITYLESKLELLSEQVHNALMEEKLAQGFHAPNECDVNRQIQEAGYPPKKDKFEKLCKKCHTDLYPYSELPENIKEYDRVTVRAVLSAIKKLGD
jgi:hypothetical protein